MFKVIFFFEIKFHFTLQLVIIYIMLTNLFFSYGALSPSYVNKCRIVMRGSLSGIHLIKTFYLDTILLCCPRRKCPGGDDAQHPSFLHALLHLSGQARIYDFPVFTDAIVCWIDFADSCSQDVSCSSSSISSCCSIPPRPMTLGMLKATSPLYPY